MNLISIAIIVYACWVLYKWCFCSKKIEHFKYTGDQMKVIITDYFKNTPKPHTYPNYLKFLESKGIKYPNTFMVLDVFYHFQKSWRDNKKI